MAPSIPVSPIIWYVVQCSSIIVQYGERFACFASTMILVQTVGGYSYLLSLIRYPLLYTHVYDRSAWEVRVDRQNSTVRSACVELGVHTYCSIAVGILYFVSSYWARMDLKAWTSADTSVHFVINHAIFSNFECSTSRTSMLVLWYCTTYQGYKFAHFLSYEYRIVWTEPTGRICFSAWQTILLLLLLLYYTDRSALDMVHNVDIPSGVPMSLHDAVFCAAIFPTPSSEGRAGHGYSHSCTPVAIEPTAPLELVAVPQAFVCRRYNSSSHNSRHTLNVQKSVGPVLDHRLDVVGCCSILLHVYCITLP